MRLSSISAKIVIKNKHNGIDKYYLKKVLKKWEKADIKDLNRDNCNAKKSAAKRFEYYTKKKSNKESKGFDEKPVMARLGNTAKKVSNTSGAVFCSTFNGF